MLILLSACIATLAIACSPGEQAEPTSTPDVATIQPEEAIANVQTLMKTIDVGSEAISRTCFQFVGDWTRARATYTGDSRWEVSVGEWTWAYFERSNAVLTIREPVLGRNC